MLEDKIWELLKTRNRRQGNVMARMGDTLLGFASFAECQIATPSIDVTSFSTHNSYSRLVNVMEGVGKHLFFSQVQSQPYVATPFVPRKYVQYITLLFQLSQLCEPVSQRHCWKAERAEDPDSFFRRGRQVRH